MDDKDIALSWFRAKDAEQAKEIERLRAEIKKVIGVWHHGTPAQLDAAVQKLVELDAALTPDKRREEP